MLSGQLRIIGVGLARGVFLVAADANAVGRLALDRIALVLECANLLLVRFVPHIAEGACS
jgi:hypothetical protein